MTIEYIVLMREEHIFLTFVNLQIIIPLVEDKVKHLCTEKREIQTVSLKIAKL